MVLLPALLDFSSLQQQIAQGPAPGCQAEIRLLQLQGKEFPQPQVCRRRARRAQEAENSEINPEKSILSILMDAGLAIKQMLLLKSAFHFNVGFLKLSPSFLANEQQEPPERLHTMIKLKQHLS